MVKVVQEALARGQEGTAERNAQVSRAIEYGKPPWKKISFPLDIFQKVAVGRGSTANQNFLRRFFYAYILYIFQGGGGKELEFDQSPNLLRHFCA